MPASLQQLSFTGGEWSDSLDPRTDLAKYATALAKMRNFFPHVHGGSSNRAGTDYVVRLKDVTKVGRLFRFQFSVVQSYVLVFEDQTLRFVKDDGVITLPAQAISGITKANPAVVTYVGADTYANGDRVIISDVSGMVEVNNREFTVANVNTGANTFELSGINSTAFTTYVSGGTLNEIYSIATTYLEADLSLLKFTQSADTIYVTHPSYPRRKITRTAHTAWTIVDVVAGSKIAAPANLITSGAGTPVYAVTASLADGSQSVPSNDIASANTSTLSWDAVALATKYTVYQKINGIYQFIGDAVGLSFVLTAAMTADPDTAAPAATNPFGSANNYPGCSCFNKQRLLYARTNNKPQTVNGSRIGDFDNNNISTPLQDDDAFELTIPSTQVNEIKWMADLNQLIIGTSGEEFKLDAQANTPLSQKVDFQSAWGASDVPPIKVGTSLLFVDGSLKKVRDLTFSFTIDGYDGSELTILSEHLFETYGIKEWAYARNPDSIIWCVRHDGILCGLTYNKEHQVFGWWTADTDGLVESVTSIQTSGGTYEVYFIVKRTHPDGSVVRYVEKLHDRIFLDTEQAYHVDCGLTYDGSVAAILTPGVGATVQGTAGVTFTAGSAVFAAGDVGRYIYLRYFYENTGPTDTKVTGYYSAKAHITGFTSSTVVTATIILAWPNLTAIASEGWRMTTTTVSGLFHLAGEEVVLLADGNVVHDLTVSATGILTLVNPASLIFIGLPYTSQMGTLGFDYPSRDGTIQNKVRNVSEVGVKVRNTGAMWVGPDKDRLIEVKFRTNENYAEPIRLFSGIKSLSILPTPAPDARVWIEQRDPLPITVGAIIPVVNAGNIS